MDKLNDLLDTDNSATLIGLEILAGIIICLVIYVISLIIESISGKIKNDSNDSPVIFSGIVDAKKSHVITQDPKIDGSITLKRSMNESGIEYTYSMWLFFNGETWDANTNFGRWKHIMHKGPKIETIGGATDPSVTPEQISPIMSPGLWLSPVDNTIRLYVNTFETNTEYVELSNLPVQKWINFVYTQRNFTTNIYINGRLKKSYTLKTLPRQNYYNLYITNHGGFSGYISKMVYYNYVLNDSKIYDMAKKGPVLERDKTDISQEDQEIKSNLPYLSNRWWVDDLTIEN
tara:strand:+ start:764 stop:1630 length:867 start_codon:yes stop_codon:yes gene_type:complete